MRFSNHEPIDAENRRSFRRRNDARTDNHCARSGSTRVRGHARGRRFLS